MATNREFFKDWTLHTTLQYYGDDVAKGFNRGFEKWLDFPRFEADYSSRNGMLCLKGKEYKGHFYTHEEFQRYKTEGMLP